MTKNINAVLKHLQASARNMVCQHQGNVGTMNSNDTSLRTFNVLREIVNYLSVEAAPMPMNCDDTFIANNNIQGLVSLDVFGEAKASDLHKSVVLKTIKSTTLSCSDNR